MTQETIENGPRDPAIRLILAHGAGAGADTPFMEAFAKGVAEAGIGVLRFEFPYMQRRRAEGTRRPPDRMPVLLDHFTQVVHGHRADITVVGGKSMGGRVASLLADSLKVRGLVCLGYPFHPAGKPDRLRTDHLAELATPTLIVQGSRDALGNRDEVAGYALSSAIRIQWLQDGDHSFKPRKASGFSQDDHIRTAIDAVVDFCRGLSDQS